MALGHILSPSTSVRSTAGAILGSTMGVGSERPAVNGTLDARTALEHGWPDRYNEDRRDRGLEEEGARREEGAREEGAEGTRPVRLRGLG